VDGEAAIRSGAIERGDTNVVRNIPIQLTGNQLIKDEIAILDIIASNLWERPVYFAVTCQRNKLFGLEDYMQLEGLGLRIVPLRNQSDLQNYGIVGSGRVNTEKLYDNVVNKFRWGNFDKERLFVDRSYQPSVQTMQLAIRRAAYELLREQNKEKAISLTDQFFEAFPDMNFPFDYRTWPMIGVYLQAGDYEKAKPYIEVLAKNTADNLKYYLSLNDKIIESSYRAETVLSYNVMESIMKEVQRQNDEEFRKKMEDLFAPFMVEEGLPD
jgi:tetratricopeptide (TPR) repeat protein